MYDEAAEDDKTPLAYWCNWRTGNPAVVDMIEGLGGTVEYLEAPPAGKDTITRDTDALEAYPTRLRKSLELGLQTMQVKR